MRKCFALTLAAGLLGLSYILVPAVANATNAYPYFKVFGGDVFSGGWFDSNANSCSTSDSNYQAPTFNPLTKQYEGGILAYAKSSRVGASTDFGAFAMGLIEGNSPSNYGFYTGPSGTNSLSFSNTDNASGDYWGGYLAGATPQIHCIPDYYDTKQDSPSNLGTASSVDLSGLGSRQYIVTPIGATISVSASTGIASGQATTLFINGNAYISGNITYAGSFDADHVPKLAIVVKGNIYISNSVSQIDGLYIAQPTSGSTGGTIWTCHDNSSSESPGYGYWIASNCGTKLTVNGSLIAKQTVLDRINGDLGSAPGSESSSSANIAEDINYTSTTVIGGPFFNPPARSTLRIDSLISLPPVY